MINRFLKLIASISIVLLSITSLSIADDHISKKEMISELMLKMEHLQLAQDLQEAREDFLMMLDM